MEPVTTERGNAKLREIAADMARKKPSGNDAIDSMQMGIWLGQARDRFEFFHFDLAVYSNVVSAVCAWGSK